jgi:hypothetical protein
MTAGYRGDLEQVKVYFNLLFKDYSNSTNNKEVFAAFYNSLTKDLEEVLSNTIYWACYNGHIDVVKYFHEIGFKFHNRYLEDAFYEGDKNLNTILYLYEIVNLNFDRKKVRCILNSVRNTSATLIEFYDMTSPTSNRVEKLMRDLAYPS